MSYKQGNPQEIGWARGLGNPLSSQVPFCMLLIGTILLISQNWDLAGRLLWIRNWKSALVDQGPLQETWFPHKDFENLFLLPNSISVEQCRNYIKHDATILQDKGFLKPLFNNDTNIVRFDKKPVHIILDRQTWLWPRAQIFFFKYICSTSKVANKMFTVIIYIIVD